MEIQNRDEKKKLFTMQMKVTMNQNIRKKYVLECFSFLFMV